MPPFRFLAIAAFATALIPCTLGAQAGGSTDILTGRVLGADSTPVQGARVEATSVETGVTRSRNTDAQGRYTIVFMDGGGPYRVTARSLGLAPQTVLIARVADEDRLVHDFSLSSIASVLETVEVTARQPPRPGDRAEPGGTERLLTGDQLNRLPIDPSDPNVIALLQPGVIGVSGTDSTAEGFSIAGQRIDQNLITLDGLMFGAGTVPQEAIRNTRVITNTYDVARGQFTGGQVATTTRGGTNFVAGSFSYSLRDPSLEFADDTTQPVSAEYTQHQLSGGVGGPVVRDRLFYFGSFQLRRRLDPLRALTQLDPLTLQQLGASPDSASRFRDLVSGAGIPLTVPAVPEDRTSDNATLIGRLDWHINDDHALMARGNWQGSTQSAFRATSLALPSHAGEQDTGGGGGMLSLTSTVGRFINEGRAYYASDDRSTAPYLSAPEGRVRVVSDLADGTTGISTLSFGGNTGMPTDRVSDQIELSDELSWLSGGGGHRFRLGALFTRTGFTSQTEQDFNGSFSFNSLEDLQANAPAEFRRSLRGARREGGVWNGAIYLGDTWRRSRAFQMTYGLRIEGSSYDGRPQYNASVDTAFSRRTDLFPHDVRLSPRLGFTWQLGFDTTQRNQDRAAQGAGRGAGGGVRGMLRGRRQGPAQGGGLMPTFIVRGGIGEFRGRAPTQLFQSAMEATGLPTGEQDLVCIGAAVPVPDWPAYLADPSTVPDQCPGAPATTSGQRPGVTVFDPAFATPRAIRSSLGVTRRFGPRSTLSADYSFALGTSLYGLRDINLDATPDFLLPLEANRPVFVPASSVVRRSGATSLLASRRVDSFGQVVEASSRLRSRTHQITLSVNGVALRNLLWTLSWTEMRSRDQTGFAAGSLGGSGGGRFGGGGLSVAGGGFGTVGAGDPNAFEWGTADLERRHSAVGAFTWLARPWLDLTSVLRVTSGQPYTPRVSGDINGDGARNDRAFVFDPDGAIAAGDTALSVGMTRLLASSSRGVRACLESQFGRIAERNSCRGAWSPSLDFQANLRPQLPTIGRRLTLVITALNPLAGLDQLLHGDNLRGWGQASRPDATLLYVRGFDPTQQRFVYQVNERFGDNRVTRTALRSPFMIGVQARLQVGPDRQREMLQGALNALNNRGRVAPDSRAIVERVSPDPTRMLVRLRDSLQLTDAQVVRIQLVGDTLRRKNETLVDSLARLVAAAPDSAGSPRALFPIIQPVLQEARANYLAAIESIRGILTAEQWAKLPGNFRNPRVRRGPGPTNRPGPGAGDQPSPASLSESLSSASLS